MKEAKKTTKKEVVTDYKTAIIDFAKSSIHNPDFFSLSKEEQQKEAMKYIRKHKKEEGE